ncbi:MAG: nuclear transport factor 2 family protein [Spirosomataceae bacterium]|jgi:hypothetical protein
MKIKRILLALILMAGFSFASQAQAEDEAVKLCVNNYLNGVMQGDAALLNQAFHPSAILRTVSASGSIQDIPVARFISTTPVGGIQSKGATTKLVSYAYVGVSALATVELQFKDFKYIDLLSMLKVGNDWKIVSRVFSRTDLDEQVRGSGATTAAAKPAPKAAPAPKKSSANVKPKADDGW